MSHSHWCIRIFHVHKLRNALIKYFFLLTDTLLKKAFSNPTFQGYSFVSSLLVLLGLIKVRFICTYSEEFAKLQKCLFIHCHYLVSLCFHSVPSSGCSEWGQGEARASGSRPPPGFGVCRSTGLLPQREHGCVGSFHVPVRTWQNDPIRRQLNGTKHWLPFHLQKLNAYTDVSTPRAHTNSGVHSGEMGLLTF